MIDSGPAFTKDAEGYSKEVYLDSLSYPTHGYGCLLKKRKYNSVKEYHDELFMEKYSQAEVDYCALGLDLDDVRRAAVVDLIYNLGGEGFKQFKDTIAALKMRDWILAATCLENSKWYKQVGRRGPRICKLIKEGRWDVL